jgi:hypothetical protein
MKEVISIYLNKEATAAANKRIAERYAYYSSLEVGVEDNNANKNKKNKTKQRKIVEDGGPSL